MTVFTRMRWFGLLAAIGFLAILSGSPAHAAFIISGNTFLDGATDGISGNDDLSGTDNWVVLHTADITAAMKSSFVPGTDSGAFDDSSAATVIYQLVNNGGGNGAITGLSQCATFELVTSWGYFDDWGLTDDGNPIGIYESMGEEFGASGVPVEGGIPDFTQDLSGTAYVDPSSVVPYGNILSWDFDPALQPESGVSSLLVFTMTTEVTAFQPEQIFDPQGRWVLGGNPSTPEPTTFALIVAGISVLLFSFRRLPVRNA